MELAELSEAWEVTRLSEVCETATGGTPSRKNPDYFHGHIPWVKSGELEDTTISEAGEGISKQAIAESNAKVFPRGTVLMAMYGATVGKLGRLAIDAATNQAVCAFFPGKKLDSGFLWHYLRGIRGELIHNSFGAAQPNISQTLIRNLEIPVPPLAEQRRIVARVEALTRRLDQARQARQAAVADAAAVGHAVWDRAFADIPTEQWQPIGAHAKVQGGYAFKSEWFVADGIRLLRNQNVYHGDLDWSDTVHLPPSRRGEFKQFELAEGDIVITMDRPLIKSGLKAARVSKKDLPCLLLQRVGRFLCDDQLERDYLLHFLFSQSFIPHISGDGRSCAVPHIAAKQIETIPIPLPSRREQRTIVARLDAMRGKLDELQRLQREVGAELASFTPALLAKAFRGEL
jgi:type I restriction enzyme, S subunit